MRVGIVGGGPGGLFLAILLRVLDPGIEVEVFERNTPDNTFGFGVVFSDRTLAGLHDADPVLADALESHGVHWDPIEVRLKGESISCGGNGMSAVRRHTLLRLLQEKAAAAGATLRFATSVTPDDMLGERNGRAFDLVVAADGTGSAFRERFSDRLEPSVVEASAKFIWFGTTYAFDGLTFIHERDEHGVFAVHGYPIGDGLGTFIVETDEATWRAAGLDAFDVTQAPGPSDERSRRHLEQLFAGQIDGARLLENNSRWGNFRTRGTRRWHVTDPQPVAFLGDAVHTAHFSVGSGTKMAMEDAVALAVSVVARSDDLSAALADYEAAARPSVDAVQAAARPSLGWWEHFGRYYDVFEPWQFAYHFFSRSITDGRLRRRDPDFVDATHRAWVAAHGAEPLDSPLDLAGHRLENRLVVTEGTGPHRRLLLPEGGSLPVAAVTAPDDESGMPEARAAIEAARRAGAMAVAVDGHVPLTRTLVAEETRLGHGLPVILCDAGLDRDRAVTAVLSGRTDLISTGGPLDTGA